MAAVDPIGYAQLCKLFPALTAKQVTNSCFYSLGANYSEAASLQNLKATAVRRSLELTQKNLGASAMPGIRNIFWCVFIVRQIINKYRLHDAQTADAFMCLESIFTELNTSEIACAVLTAGGYTIGHIGKILRAPDEAIYQLIDRCIVKLNVESAFFLKLLIVSRLMVDLS